MDHEKKWKVVDPIPLGGGGQAKVYKVSPRLSKSDDPGEAFAHAMSVLLVSQRWEVGSGYYDPVRAAIVEMSRNEGSDSFGALKVLHEPQYARDAKLAQERMRREVGAMVENLHPHLLKIVDHDSDTYQWYVSVFYSGGTLHDKIDMCKGDVVTALRVVRPLVEAVATLHKGSYVHRDIKPKNVFVDADSKLILGDFGLVHFADPDHTRISEIHENVGTHSWMPPWAMDTKLEDVKPSFDVYSLGKLLWSLVSGRPVLQLWYFNRSGNNIEEMFPIAPGTRLLNKLLSKCIVELEADCLSNTSAMLQEIDQMLQKLEVGADALAKDLIRKCQVCGEGKYNMLADMNRNAASDLGFSAVGNTQFRIFACDACGHMQTFLCANSSLPPAWES